MPLHHLNSKNYSVVLLSVETGKTSYVGERGGGGSSHIKVTGMLG